MSDDTAAQPVVAQPPETASVPPAAAEGSAPKSVAPVADAKTTESDGSGSADDTGADKVMSEDEGKVPPYSVMHLTSAALVFSIEEPRASLGVLIRKLHIVPINQ